MLLIFLFSMETLVVVRQYSYSTETGTVDVVDVENNTGLVRPLTEQATTSRIFQDYGSTGITRYENQRPNLHRSLLRSMWTSVTINVAVIPLGFLMILLLYIDINTTILWFHFEQQCKGKLPNEVMNWQLVGNVVETIIINFWFQLTLVLLFGWQRFKSHHSSTMLLGFLRACLIAIFKIIVFIRVKQDFSKRLYRYPGNFVFLAGVVDTSYLVSAKICKINHTLVLRKGSDLHNHLDTILLRIYHRNGLQVCYRAEV